MRNRKPDKIPITLIERLIETAKKIGIPKTETLLINASLSNNPEQLMKVGIIRNAVCHEYQITDNKLKEYKAGNTSTEAADVYAYLLYKYLKFTKEDIKTVFEKRYNHYSECIKRIQCLDCNIKPERELISRISNIENSIKESF